MSGEYIDPQRMPPEPEGLPSAADISQMEVEVWQAGETIKSAFLRKDRDLAVECWRIISGDSEADLPAQYDIDVKWRTREKIDAPLDPEKLEAAEKRVKEIRKRMGL